MLQIDIYLIFLPIPSYHVYTTIPNDMVDTYIFIFSRLDLLKLQA